MTADNTIESGVWVQVVRKPNGEVAIFQGPDTTLADALGLVRYADLTYETEYKLRLELQNGAEKMQQVMNKMSEMLGQMLTTTKMIEGAMIKSSALAENIRKKV